MAGSQTLTLGFETSCDETAAAVVRDGRQVLSNVIASQVPAHLPFGGVVPEIAARRHIETIRAVTEQALSDAGVALADIGQVAVANGPGLVGALLVGLSYAKALAYALHVPLAGVHHIEAHVCANYLDDGGLQPPFLALVVSGGHTTLLRVAGYNRYETLGATRDDAAGEAFDKAARALGLPYPGGPAIDRLARAGDDSAVRFPVAKLGEAGTLDFSFSGLKSALLQYLRKPRETSDADVAASFQKAVVDALVERAMRACDQNGFRQLVLAGGVASNTALRWACQRACDERGFSLRMPEPVFCTDNAAMVACRGFYALTETKGDGYALNAYPSRAVGR